MVPADVLAAAGLNAEMRAIAERAASGVEQRSARPPVAIDPAEVAEDGAAQMDAAETAADALGVPKVVPPPAYQPIAPFGLTFTFNTQTGGYAGVTMSDATFWWNDAGTLTEKTASVGQLTLSGTVYLNVSLDAQGKYASAAVRMSASGDMSLKLYQLDQNGVVKDYRHAMVVLCANEDNDTHYYADDKSIEKARPDVGLAESEIFTLKGFGKFRKSGSIQYGSFVASTEIELGSTAMNGASVLVRIGDADTLNGNSLGFARLKIPENDEKVPTPFQYTGTEEEQSGETVIVKSIINRAFYWDGRLITSVQDDSGFVIPLTGDVYLKCVGNKNASSQDADANGYVWTFTVGTTPATASGTQKVFNFKLYTFANGKLTMDWRDTFLALWSGAGSGAEPDGVSIDKIPDAAPGTTPTGDEGKLEIKGFSEADDGSAPYKSNGKIVWGGKTIASSDDSDGITIEYSDGTSDHIPAPDDGQDGQDGASVTGATAGTATSSGGKTITPITFTLSNGNTVGPVNVEAKDGAAASLDKEFSVDGTKVADIAASANINISQKSLAAGQNITLTPSQDGKTITISAAGGSGGTSGFTGTRYTIKDVRYNISTKRLQMMRYEETWVNGVMTSCTPDADLVWEDFSAGALAVPETV